MTDKEKLENMGYEDILVFENPNFDGALIGVSDDNRAIYDYEKMIDSCMKQEGWTSDEAEDWISYNTIRSLSYYEGAPIIMYPIE